MFIVNNCHIQHVYTRHCTFILPQMLLYQNFPSFSFKSPVGDVSYETQHVSLLNFMIINIQCSKKTSNIFVTHNPDHKSNF